MKTYLFRVEDEVLFKQFRTHCIINDTTMKAELIGFMKKTVAKEKQ